ncbi:MAG: hypothetical protein ACE5O2_16170, partial [Armatimonadota bacterium]
MRCFSRTTRVILASVVAGVVSGAAQAHLHLGMPDATSSSAEVARGETITVSFVYVISHNHPPEDRPWPNPWEVRLDGTPGVRDGALLASGVQWHPAAGETISFVVSTPVTIPPDTPPGLHVLKVVTSVDDRWLPQSTYTAYAYVDIEVVLVLRAEAGPDHTVEQTSLDGAEVTLDGTGSFAECQGSCTDPTTFDEAVAAGATVVDVLPDCVSYDFDGVNHSSNHGEHDFGICDALTLILYWDWWYSETSWGEAYPGFLLVGQAGGGGWARLWPTNGGGEFFGYIDVYEGDLTPPSTVPWRLIVSPDGRRLAWIRLCPEGGSQQQSGAISYLWTEGDTVLGTDPIITPTLQLGEHTMTLTVKDECGQKHSDQTVVTVVDTTPPEVELEVLEPVLWPPNHKMVLAAVVEDVEDICDANPIVNINVTSNEPINGPGDGDTEPDYEIVRDGDEWQVWLRAERGGPGSGREYT